MKKAFEVINGLKKKGVIIDYAIGGGIATQSYTEPFYTYDIDVFIVPTASFWVRGLLTFTPIVDFLKANKYHYKWEREHLIIEGTPVQFIAPKDELEEEAIRTARIAKYNSKIRVKVFATEYLLAVLLRAWRDKDIMKIRSSLINY